MRVSATSAVDGDELLLRRYHRHPDDQSLRDELVQRFMPLARSLARRYASRGEPLEDLEQVAALGLIKALDRFDPDRGSAFSSFAVPTILGELRRHFRDTTWAVRPTRAIQELTGRLSHVTEALSAELQRSPTEREVANALGCDVETVLDAREALRQYRPRSLDEPTSGEGRETVGEHVGQVDEHYEYVEDALAVGPALDSLPDRDRVVLLLRFEEDLTQAEIASRVGLSQMHVSRIIRRALQRVRIIVDGHATAPDEALAA